MGKLLLLAVGLAACDTTLVDHAGAGDDTVTSVPDGGGLNTAHTLYVQTVAPILAVCAACHGRDTGLVVFDYDTITTTPALDGGLGTPTFNAAFSLIVSKGAHAGPQLTADQTATIFEWLNAEQAARY